MTKDEALRKALEALDSDNPDIQLRAAIIIRGVLAQHDSVQENPEPEQEPYAIEAGFDNGDGTFSVRIERLPLTGRTPIKDWSKHEKLLYTTPPQRKPLTDEQIGAIDELMKLNTVMMLPMEYFMRVVRAVEAAHGIKE